MAQSASCPSCGAPVVFQSAASIFAVCDYCQSTLVRHDQALEDIGKMAALVEDRSPLQIGAEGSYQGVHFALIGRIQIKYEQGVWNEWHIMFDDMRNAWLSEAAGEYVLSFSRHVNEVLPTFDSLQIGQRFLLDSQPWTVSNIESAECIAGQGELPFMVGAGYPFATVDLRNGANFATLDYSETPPLLFVGEAVKFASLKMSNLREGMPIPEHTVEAQVFRCPSCGSPMQARSKDILAVGCGSCGAVVDAADQNYKILSKALGSAESKYLPRIPLGSKGVLEGATVEAIGFLVKECVVDGLTYRWREYLLAAEHGAYRWLTEYDGHWNIVDVLSNPPKVSLAGEMNDIRWSGEVFKHFTSTPSAKVIQVEGEFTWRVRRGETCRVVDYICPPLMLSRESTEKEISWSQGAYVEPEVLTQVFKLSSKWPEPVGIYANQPNPWGDSHKRVCRLFWKLALLAIVVQAYFFFASAGKQVLAQSVQFEPARAQETVQSRDFVLPDAIQKVTVRNDTNLSNNWIGLDMVLVNKVTGLAWPASREVSYYYGSSGGESWSEGSRDDDVVFLDIPAGTYYLTLDPEMAPGKPLAVRDQITVFTGGVSWSNFIFVMIFLVVFPVFTRLRHAGFEAKRWAESDHAPEVSDDSDDD